MQSATSNNYIVHVVVKAVTPGKGANGLVSYQIETDDELREFLEVEVPYQDCETEDEAIRQSADLLHDIALGMAEAARKISTGDDSPVG